jgi:hypothetical protein
LAGQFVASRAPDTVYGVGVGEQEFKFEPFHISCVNSKESSEVAETMSATFFVKLHFGRCKTHARLGENEILLRTEFKTPVSIEYHANGFVEAGGESESTVSLTNATEIEIVVPPLKCFIHVPPQTVPARAELNPGAEFSQASYSTTEVPVASKLLFPTGFQKQLVIQSTISHLAFNLQEGQCEEFLKTEGGGGSYHGTIQLKETRGNLSFE